MKKIVIPKAGSYEQLTLQDCPDPSPKAGELLIEVKAAGVNYADCCVRMGLYKSAKEYVGWPITPGFEVAGVVRELGPGVSSFQVGDEVIGVTRFDGYCSHIALGERWVTPKPETMSFEQAATFPAVFLTASYALYELANPRAGQAMLVHSAAGGVGSSLVQLGKAAGCHVVGVVGASHKVETALAMGADAVIDKSKQDLWSQARSLSPLGGESRGHFQMIFDANGVATLKDSYEHLAAPGRLVVYGFHTMLPRKGGRPNWLKLAWDWLKTPRFNPLDMTSDNRSVLAFNLSYLFEQAPLFREHMDTLLGLFSEGKIKCPPVKSYALSDVAQAHKDIESAQTVGKLALLPV